MKTIWALATVAIKELYRRKDFYVLFVLTALITLLMASASFFKKDNVVDSLKEICFLLIWVSGLVIAVATAARQIPAERENRTIFPLLAKPVSRGQVILGKFLGCWLACAMALVLFYTFLAVMSASREHEWRLLNYFQALWMQWMFLGVVTGMVLLGSVIFAAPSSNATICLVVVVGILMMGHYMKSVAQQQPEPLRTLLTVGYYVIPHLEFFDLRDFVIYHKGTVAWMPIVLASVYAGAYTAFFLFGTWISFRRKALNT